MKVTQHGEAFFLVGRQCKTDPRRNTDPSFRAHRRVLVDLSRTKFAVKVTTIVKLSFWFDQKCPQARWDTDFGFRAIRGGCVLAVCGRRTDPTWPTVTSSELRSHSVQNRCDALDSRSASKILSSMSGEPFAQNAQQDFYGCHG